MTMKAALDRANAGSLPDLFRLVKLGKLLRGQFTQVLRKKDPAADAAVDATCHSIVLPNDAKAAQIVRAYARVGTATVGEMVVDAPGTVQTTTLHCGVAPNGDLSFLAADAWSSVDVIYTPERGDALVLPELPVASNAILLPAPAAGKVVLLIDANATAGTTTGRKIIEKPSASAATAGCARLDLAKLNVKFAGADAVTKAIVTLLVIAEDDLDTILESADTIL